MTINVFIWYPHTEPCAIYFCPLLTTFIQIYSWLINQKLLTLKLLLHTCSNQHHGSFSRLLIVNGNKLLRTPTPFSCNIQIFLMPKTLVRFCQSILLMPHGVQWESLVNYGLHNARAHWLRHLGMSPDLPAQNTAFSKVTYLTPVRTTDNQFTSAGNSIA